MEKRVYMIVMSRHKIYDLLCISCIRSTVKQIAHRIRRFIESFDLFMDCFVQRVTDDHKEMQPNKSGDDTVSFDPFLPYLGHVEFLCQTLGESARMFVHRFCHASIPSCQSRAGSDGIARYRSRVVGPSRRFQPLDSRAPSVCGIL